MDTAVVVVAFVELNEVEEVVGETCEPLVVFALKLLDVGDDDVRFVEVADVARASPDLCGFWERCVGQHIAFEVEVLGVARRQVIEELLRTYNLLCP